MITLYPQGLVWQKKTRAKQQTTKMPYSNLCARHYAETKPPGASTQSASRAGNILTDTWTLFSVQRLHGFPQLVQFSQILGHDPKASNDTAIWHGKRYFFSVQRQIFWKFQMPVNWSADHWPCWFWVCFLGVFVCFVWCWVFVVCFFILNGDRSMDYDPIQFSFVCTLSLWLMLPLH